MTAQYVAINHNHRNYRGDGNRIALLPEMLSGEEATFRLLKKNPDEILFTEKEYQFIVNSSQLRWPSIKYPLQWSKFSLDIDEVLVYRKHGFKTAFGNWNAIPFKKEVILDEFRKPKPHYFSW